MASLANEPHLLTADTIIDGRFEDGEHGTCNIESHLKFKFRKISFIQDPEKKIHDIFLKQQQFSRKAWI